LAAGSVKQYEDLRRRFEQWCGLNGQNPEEYSFENIATFLLSLLNDQKAFGTIENYVAAFADRFKYTDDKDPTKDKLMKGLLNAMKRFSPPPRKKTPVNNDHFRILATEVDQENFLQVRNHTAFVLMYKGMLRSDNAANLKAKHLWLDELEGDEVLFLFLEKSKTDQLRIGHTIVLGKGKEQDSCPIYWFKRYVQLRDSKAKAFFHHEPKGKKFRSIFLAASTINSRFKESLAKAGVSDYLTSHSLRAGGVTEALRNQVDLRLVRKHGNWKSDAIYVYITESMENMLSVSKSF
jgi:site-specific recombinase XerD